MPIIQIDMLEGRDTDMRAEIIREVTDAFCRTTGNRPETVHVVLRDIPLDSWGQGGVTKAEQKRTPG